MPAKSSNWALPDLIARMLSGQHTPMYLRKGRKISFRDNATNKTQSVVHSRLLDYAHVIHESREVRAEIVKAAFAPVFTVAALIARRDAGLIRFLKIEQEKERGERHREIKYVAKQNSRTILPFSLIPRTCLPGVAKPRLMKRLPR